MADFIWTTQKEQAALSLAEGELTDESIASAAGVTRQTLSNWKKTPEFASRIEEHVAAFRERVRRRGIAIIDRRVDSLNDRWNRLHQVMLERAADETMRDIPGGPTGLLVRRIKSVGSGEHTRIVEEYEVDTGLLREMREHEKQAAQELGQWIDKTDVTSQGEPVHIATVEILNPHGEGTE